MKPRAIAACASLLLYSLSAFAGLGKDISSLHKDARMLGARLRVTEHPRYLLHEISHRWIRVRQFSGRDGKIFALAWRGKKHPDLKALLGDHLSDFQRAVAEARNTRRHGGSLAATVGRVHVNMGGHMGAMHGQVWLTDKLPSGMDLHEIR